jgi:hypothetical protein
MSESRMRLSFEPDRVIPGSYACQACQVFRLCLQRPGRTNGSRHLRRPSTGPSACKILSPSASSRERTAASTDHGILFGLSFRRLEARASRTKSGASCAHFYDRCGRLVTDPSTRSPRHEVQTLEPPLECPTVRHADSMSESSAMTTSGLETWRLTASCA